MVLGEDRSDRIARGTVGNRNGDLLASRDVRVPTGNETLDGRHDKEDDRDKREHGDDATDNHGHRGAFLLRAAAGMGVVARARSRGHAVRTMSTMRMGAGLRSLRLCALHRRLLLKASAASGLRRTGSGLLGYALGRLLGPTLDRLSGGRGGLSRALRRLHRALARLGRTRRRLPCTIRLARIGSARHAEPPRFYDRATSAKTGWRRSCQSCPSSAFR